MTNSKKVKREKRRVRKVSKEIIKNALIDLQRYPFLERVKFAWFIVKGRK
jgi:hypothetical protein